VIYKVVPEVLLPADTAGTPETKGFLRGTIPQAHLKTSQTFGNRAVSRQAQADWWPPAVPNLSRASSSSIFIQAVDFPAPAKREKQPSL